MDVFVVIGTVGEYSDRREWTVAAYADSALADEHVRRAEERARALEAEVRVVTQSGGSSWEFWQTALNQYDTAMQTDYWEAADYYSVSVPLLDAIPEAA